MNALLASTKYRAGYDGWVFPDDDDTFDDFVPPSTRRVPPAHGLALSAAEIHQHKWELRTRTSGGDDVRAANPDEEGDSRPTAPEEMEGSHTQAEYPPSLIRWFAIGVIAFAVGAVLVLVSAAVGAINFGFVATLLLAFGATVVALALLRGREINEGAA